MSPMPEGEVDDEYVKKVLLDLVKIADGKILHCLLKQTVFMQIQKRLKAFWTT
ncbi:MAG: hypothetical protein L6V93_10910 [Clostridiales bacterium]|nr:MAG: hypothetical protein L6V93_10910 [Clostridiales bacterium]